MTYKRQKENRWELLADRLGWFRLQMLGVSIHLDAELQEEIEKSVFHDVINHWSKVNVSFWRDSKSATDITTACLMITEQRPPATESSLG